MAVGRSVRGDVAVWDKASCGVSRARTSAKAAIWAAREGVSSSSGARVSESASGLKRPWRSSGTMRRPAMRLTMAIGRWPSRSV